MIRKDFIGNNRTVRILFFLISPFLLYLPVIDKYFVSDDFKVLNRVCLQQVILIKRFFRPLSDLTIYLNYLVGGFNPVVFNSFNILIHGINSLLLYQLCTKIRITAHCTLSKSFPFLTAVLFMTYPFHNEGVVWLLGRGASISCGFALAGMLAMLSHFSLQKKILLTCICYFTGLLAYESIIFLPLIILILASVNGMDRKEKQLWIFSLLLTLALHLVIRILISGSIVGSYGDGFFKRDLTNYLLNVPKTAIRLVLPPAGHSHSIIFAYAGILACFIVLSILLIRQMKNKPFMSMLAGPFWCLCVACITPVFSGISTNTSESDRMLYFPSLFLCMVISMLLTFFTVSSFRKLLIFGLLFAYNIFFLEKNNANWALAGDSTRSLVHFLKNKTTGKTYVMDIPEEYKGAYIFRQGLYDALHINGIDSSSLIVVNYLTRDQADLTPRSTFSLSGLVLHKDDEVIFWDKRSFIRLPIKRK
jgi:hypothetical protein